MLHDEFVFRVGAWVCHKTTREVFLITGVETQSYFRYEGETPAPEPPKPTINVYTLSDGLTVRADELAHHWEIARKNTEADTGREIFETYASGGWRFLRYAVETTPALEG